VDTLADLYRTKSDEELLLLSVEMDELTDEARDALKAEMSLRRLTADEVEQLRFDRQIDERVKEKRSKASDLLRKRTRFGKRDLVLLDKTKRERFTTTFFIPVAYLPLIPVGTYRIEKLRARWRSKLIVLEKKPLDWEQVLAAWVMSGGIALIAIWVFKLWIRFGAR
jgi:hypothetical protein